MASCKLRDVKIGEAIRINNEIWIVFDRHEQTRGNLRTYWQVKLKNLDRGNVYEQRFSPDDVVDKIMLNREEYEYLYADGNMFVFMHPESYEQVSVAKDLIPTSQHGYMVPNLRMNLLKVEERIALVELPQAVELEVTDAPDGARGDTATNVTKLVMVETGVEVRVPGHIKVGDKVKIRVEDGDFLGRVN